jgi:hypothetical protein
MSTVHALGAHSRKLTPVSDGFVPKGMSCPRVIMRVPRHVGKLDWRHSIVDLI